MQLRKAHNEQIQIGMQIFFKGIISKKWGQLQEEDYRRHHMPAKYNRIRWEKRLITPLQDIATTVWNEQCTIIHVANVNTNEIR